MANYSIANKKYAALAQKLIDADPSELGHIDLTEVIFLEIEETKPKQAMKIAMIREPFVMLTSKKFYIAINEELVSEYNDEQIELELYRTLYHISPEPDKMRFPDVRDFSFIINKFGFDWREKNIPSILDMLKKGQSIH